MEEMVTITKARYDQMVKELDFLEALRQAGVDNWQGYDEAVNILHEWQGEQDE
jgi:hypothetical protein